MTRLYFGLIFLMALSSVALGNELWGGITLRNYGGYVAKLVVTYKLNDEYKSVDSGRFSVGQSRNIPLPPEATNVLVQGYLDMFINSWSNIFADSVGLPTFRCYKVGGVTIKPTYEIIDC